MAIKSAEERARAIKEEAAAIEAAAAAAKAKTDASEAVQDPRAERKLVEERVQVREAAAAEERAMAALVARADDGPDGKTNLMVAQRDHMLKLEQEEDLRLRAEYKRQQERQQSREAKNTVLRGDMTSREAFTEQLRLIRQQPAAEPLATQKPTPRQMDQTQREMAAGAARVAYFESQKPVVVDTNPERDGYVTPVFQPNPTQQEKFPTTSKASSQGV